MLVTNNDNDDTRQMSRPAWMTDELEEEWVEPEWEEDGSEGAEISQRSQRSRRSAGGSRVQRSPHVYGSVRVASSSPGSSSDMGGSMRERSVRDLLESAEGGKRKASAPQEKGAASGATVASADGSPVLGTFLVREDVAPEPLKVAPAAFGLRKSGVKNFFSPLALERMFEPPSPPPDGNSPKDPQPTASSSPPTSDTASTNTQEAASAPTSATSTTPTSATLSKSPSPGNTTPSPNTFPARTPPNGLSFPPSPSAASSSPYTSFNPSPSAGRGPLGTFRLPHNPHAPIRPSRLSESHLVKPYASFEADETVSSRSSLPKDILADISEHIMPEPSTSQRKFSASPSIQDLMGALDDDDERLTNDFDFGDDEFVVGDDLDAEDADGEADSILDVTSSDVGRGDKTPQGGMTRREPKPLLKAETQSEEGKHLGKGKGKAGHQPDEIIDTDIPGLALFDGRKLSGSYQFTFPDPRNDGDKGKPAATSPGTPQKKEKDDRKREREEERQRRHATRALLYPHDALRSITPDVDSRPSSRASTTQEIDRSPSPYTDNSPGPSNTTQASRSVNLIQFSRDDQRTPSPNQVPRDPRLKLFQFHYDTFTRDHLSALVDSIAVGSVGSSPSVKLNTMEFRGEDPRALSTPSDAVRYAKKIKLTPPEEYSDWDGSQEAEESGEQTEAGDNGEGHLRPPSTAVSATQQEEQDQEQDMSTESSATDYRRRGADLMAQIRGEMSEDEGDGSMRSGSIRSASMRSGSLSVRGGSMLIKSPQANLAELATHLRAGRESAVQDSIGQLTASIRAIRLGDQARQDGLALNRADMPQPPTIMVSNAGAPNLPRLRSNSASRVADEGQRIQPQSSTSGPTRPHLAPRHPSTSPAREDMNRFVSASSTVVSKSTACSAGSFVKHPGPPASVLSHSGSGVRQIGPADLPAEALPERIGKMVYDREAMRWRQERQEHTDGNLSESSEDPFKDFDSFRSNAGDDRSDSAGSAPMDEDDEQEESIRDDTLHLDMTTDIAEPVGLSVVEELPESGFEHDSDSAEEQSTIHPGPSPKSDSDVSLPQPSEPTPKAFPSSLSARSRPPELAVDTSINEPTTTRMPLRPALKSASTTPAPSLPTSRQSTVDPATPMPGSAKNRRSVSFSDGRLTGKIRGLVAREEEESLNQSDATNLTLTPVTTEFSPSSRMKRIGNLLDELEDDSMLRSLSIAPYNQSSGESDEETTEHSDMVRGDPDVDPDVSRAPRTSSRARSDRAGSQRQSTVRSNATFLTECSFGVAHDKLVQLITDVHPYQPYWEPLSEIDLSKKGIESLARLKEFLPNLDRLDVQGNELTYLSGIPMCLRELNVAKNQLTSLTSYAHLANLEILDISNNRIESVAQLKCLRHLRELSAAGNTISDLSGIAQTTSLTKINLKGNCLKVLSLEDCSWPHVEHIDFSGNNMKSIVGLSGLTTLVTLNLGWELAPALASSFININPIDHNGLSSLDIDGPLPRLRVLRLSDNKLTELNCSPFTNLRTLYADNNRLVSLRHADKARRLENLSLRNQSGRGLHLSVADIRDIKRMYLSGNPLDPGFLEVPCYNLIYLELAACRLSTLPSDLSKLVPNVRVLNLNYNFLSDVRPLDGLVRLRKLTIIGSRIKATKPLLRTLQSMKEIEMLDFRMNPFSLGWYLPLLVRDIPGALQPSETTGKHDAPWSDLDVKFRRDLPDELYIGRLAYRGLIMRVCTQLRIMDGIEITTPERAKAQKLLAGIEKSHRAKVSASSKD
ncbi:Septation initiation network scaffold protein cdc11 [Ceratobasidium sp. AG-Ba]|nr:Septation initiation network scaffold protein cdc11 [Ceratobasidium sp. AG-Ba]